MTFATNNVEQLMKQVNEQVANAKVNARKMADLAGTGQAADGKVTVTVGATGKLISIELDPRAMRLPSTDLVAAIIDAARVAEQDAAAQVREIWAGQETGGLDIASVAQGDVDVMTDLDARLDRAREAIHRAR